MVGPRAHRDGDERLNAADGAEAGGEALLGHPRRAAAQQAAAGSATLGS